MYVLFSTCLRIRYALDVAAQLGYADIDGPESRLAVSFTDACRIITKEVDCATLVTFFLVIYTWDSPEGRRHRRKTLIGSRP